MQMKVFLRLSSLISKSLYIWLLREQNRNDGILQNRKVLVALSFEMEEICQINMIVMHNCD